jgi:hypothetical protein
MQESAKPLSNFKLGNCIQVGENNRKLMAYVNLLIDISIKVWGKILYL